MFNLGFSELLILGAIALIFIGPKELPEIAKALGRLISELKRATGDLSSTLLNPEQHLKEHLNLPKFEDKPIFYAREGQEQKEHPHNHEDSAAKKEASAPVKTEPTSGEGPSEPTSQKPTSSEHKPS